MPLGERGRVLGAPGESNETLRLAALQNSENVSTFLSQVKLEKFVFLPRCGVNLAGASDGSIALSLCFCG